MEGTDCEVLDRRSVGPATVALVLAAPPGFEAAPGQFVQLRADVDGEAVTRHYSISSPVVADQFEVTVGVDPNGTLSPWLATVEPGTAVAIDGPYGRVHYEDESHVVVLAAGPGIGPAVGVAERTIGDGGEAAVVYRTETPVHERRLAGLARAAADVFLASTSPAFEAAVAAVVDRGQVLVYGFQPFVDDATAAIRRAGGDPDDARVENFG